MSERRGFERLYAACATVRRHMVGVTLAGAMVSGSLGVLLLSFLPAGAREGRGSWAPLTVAAVVGAAWLAGAWSARRMARRVRPDALAEEIDRGLGLGAGDVRAALELERRAAERPGADLAELHRARVAAEVSRRGVEQLLPLTGPRWRRRARRAAVLVSLALVALTLTTLARPRPTRSAAVALGAPWRTAFPAKLPPLRVRAESGVARGAPGVVVVHAPGREAVTLAWQAPARAVARRALVVAPTGVAEGRTDPIDAPTRVWAEGAAGETSDTLTLRPLEPLLVQDLRVRLEYPAYLGRGAETHRGQIPPLVTPEGTRIVVAGETNAPLDRARLVGAPGDGEASRPGPVAVPLEVNAAQFAGAWVPERSGAWAWELASSSAVGDPILPDPIRVVLVPDAAPRIALLYPAPDTTLGPDRVMPLVVDVEDDIGLRRVALHTWRSGLGAQRAEARRDLAPDPAGSSRVVLRDLIDLRDDELLPGDTVFYRFEAFDGHPRRGPGLSDVFTLRVPTLAEIRAERAAETDALAGEAADLEAAFDALARAAADAARQTDARPEESEEARFEATKEARGVLDDAERAADELSGLEEALRDMREELDRSALSDEGLRDQLRKLAERYEALVASGLADRIRELAEALAALDPDAVREALQRLADDSERLREQLEQTLGLLEQAALEQAVRSAEAEASDLAERQRALAERDADPAAWSAEQADLAEEAALLEEALAELERELETAGRPTAADSAAAAGERTAEARRRMDAAGGQAEAGDEAPVSDAQRGAARDASSRLEEAASALGAAQRQMSGEGRESAVETLTRARSEALSLAREQERLAEAARGDDAVDPEQWRARQGAVRQGLENLVRQLSGSGNEASMLGRRTGAAAGEAAERMDRLLERLAADGAPRMPARAEAEAIQGALAGLARELLAEESAARAGQQAAEGQRAGEQMASLAQQQQGLAQETSSLLVPGPPPAGAERTREQLARRQQEIADELGRVDDREGELLGRPEELAREAAELARRLERDGPSQETLERQRRLFRRMLDAGRSLEDDDLDPNRRESRTGAPVPRSPPVIDPARLRGPGFPLPPEALLRELPIFYRALIFDYFDRLNREPPAATADPP